MDQRPDRPGLRVHPDGVGGGSQNSHSRRRIRGGVCPGVNSRPESLARFHQVRPQTPGRYVLGQKGQLPRAEPLGRDCLTPQHHHSVAGSGRVPGKDHQVRPGPIKGVIDLHDLHDLHDLRGARACLGKARACLGKARACLGKARAPHPITQRLCPELVGRFGGGLGKLLLPIPRRGREFRVWLADGVPGSPSVFVEKEDVPPRIGQ